MEHTLMTLSEVRAMLKISQQTLWRLRRDGKLATVNIGSRRLVRRVDVERLVAESAANSNKRGGEGQ